VRTHEKSDVDVRLIPRIAVIFVISLVIIHIGSWWLFRFYQNRDQARDAGRGLVEQTSTMPPPPRLQVRPEAEWEQFRQIQFDLLDSYGWVSSEDQRVHIPIRRAMELLVEREKEKQ